MLAEKDYVMQRTIGNIIIFTFGVTVVWFLQPRVGMLRYSKQVHQKLRHRHLHSTNSAQNQDHDVMISWQSHKNKKKVLGTALPPSN